MNYKRIALGLLCGLLCVAPAFAGVVDADLTSKTSERKVTDLGEQGSASATNYKAVVSGSYYHQGSDKFGRINVTVENTDGAKAKAEAIYSAYGKVNAGRSTVSKVSYSKLTSGSEDWRGSKANAEYLSKEHDKYRNLGSYNRFSQVGVEGEFFAWKVTDTKTEGKVNRDDKFEEDKVGTTTTTNYLFVGDVDDFTNTYEIGGKQHTVYNDKKWVEVSGGLTKVYQIDVFGYTSPIVLDLDGDGVIEASKGQYLSHPTTFAYDSHVAMFDFHGNGFPVLTEWVGKNDGLLCRPEADGSVKGVNLFGTSNGSENGYEDMALLDANQSGALEGAELEGLYVWQDRNCNGIADKGELSAVQSLGITSISVKHDNMTSTFVRNGQTFKSFDWWPSVMDVREVKVSSF